MLSKVLHTKFDFNPFTPFSQRHCCKPIIMSPCCSAETYVCFPSAKSIISVVVQTHHWPDTRRNYYYHHYNHQYALNISMCVKCKGHPLTCLCRDCCVGGDCAELQPIHNLGTRRRWVFSSTFRSHCTH
jgi:hypothetical protein